MKSIFSNQPEDLKNIFLDNIELVGLNRPYFEIDNLSKKFIDSRQNLDLEWIQGLDCKNYLNDPLSIVNEQKFKSILQKEINESSEMLGKLMGCKKVLIRLSTHRKPMCPRFHVDKIRCRLLITLYGDGTEWISNKDVDWKIFAKKSDSSEPIKKLGKVRKLKAGQWSLLKGGDWNTNFQGVVHRSPHGIGERLLLSMDPIFN